MRKGFTLIELLVVITLMGILAVIGFGQFSTAQAKARDVERKADLSSISKALLFYYSDYGKMPNGVSPDPDINNLISSKGQFSRDNYVYISKMPSEVKVGGNIKQYCYIVSADQKSFIVLSSLENKKDSDCKSYVVSSGICSGTYNFSVASPNTLVSSFATVTNTCP